VQRVAIIGTGGAGKSTLARRMGERLGIEVLHLDHLFWQPGWEATPSERWRALQGRFVACDRWIMDGNYVNSMPVRVAAADTVVFVDLPRRTTILRAVRRWWRHRGEDVQAFGCPERVDWEFLWWMWRFPRDTRPRLLATLAEHAGVGTRVVMLRSPSDVERFLAELPV
jgi:adenylate kinase family enzyme